MLSIRQNILSSQSLSYSMALSQNTEVSISKAGSIEKSVPQSEAKKSEFSGDKFEGKIRKLASAEIGVQNGISKLQRADSALGDTENILRQMREIAQKALGGDFEQEKRSQMQNKLKDLRSKIDDIAKSTDFNSENLFNGEGISISTSSISMTSLTAAIAIDSKFSFNELASHLQSGDVFRIPVEPVSSDSLGLDKADISTDESSEETSSIIDEALKSIGAQRNEFGGILSGLSMSISHMQSMSYNLTAAGGSIDGVEAAFKTISETKAQLTMNSQALFSAHSNGALNDAVYSLLK